MKLIDKDALVAEIEKRIKNLYPKSGQGMVVTKILKDHYEDLLSFINALEVKEVDLEKELEVDLLQEFNDFLEIEKTNLTWQDIKEIATIGMSFMNSEESDDLNEEEYYTGILKRFIEKKGGEL